MRLRLLVWLYFLISLGLATCFADDGAASIAAGGIVMVREPRITMHKEVLKIGLHKVAVEYEFRNDSDADIITEVAFPVPAYSLNSDEHEVKAMRFDDFRLTVEGKEVRYDVETKATFNGKDVSALLRRDGIDISTFGHFDQDRGWSNDIRKLSKAQLLQLVKAGLLVNQGGADEITWSVEKKYYWKQTFPAHGLVHISHQYTPVVGNSNQIGLGPTPKEDSFEAKAACIDPSLRSQLQRLVTAPKSNVWVAYVGFILTTANTWKTPIEDFTLIVERPHRNDMQGTRKIKGETFVSFCWDGPVTKIDADHFSAHIDDFIPKKELNVSFITSDDWFKDAKP